ncbi:MAG: hypothetical protein WC791_01685 [Candidatus Paceibacterota bacterium]|jgi:hypothetical protein
MKHFAYIFSLVIVSLGGGILVANAQGYVPLQSLPGIINPSTGTTDLPTYLAGMIKLLIALGAGLAVLYGVIGGTQYVAAGISPDAKSGAKERIVNALIGLTIILSSYLVLNSINPDLVNFKLTLDSVTVRNMAPTLTPGVGGNGTGVIAPGSDCSVPTPDMSLLDDPAASAMEGGNNVIWSSNDPTVQSNLTALNKEVVKLQYALPELNSGYTVNVTSAYRPYNYQKHLFQVFTAYNTFKDNNDPLCVDEKAAVGSEYSSHGLGSLVSNPDSQNSPHMYGTGVDLSPVGVNFSNFSQFGYTDINAFMVHEGIMLSWQNIQGDQWHFNLR